MIPNNPLADSFLNGQDRRMTNRHSLSGWRSLIIIKGERRALTRGQAQSFPVVQFHPFFDMICLAKLAVCSTAHRRYVSLGTVLAGWHALKPWSGPALCGLARAVMARRSSLANLLTRPAIRYWYNYCAAVAMWTRLTVTTDSGFRISMEERGCRRETSEASRADGREEGAEPRHNVFVNGSGGAPHEEVTYRPRLRERGQAGFGELIQVLQPKHTALGAWRQNGGSILLRNPARSAKSSVGINLEASAQEMENTV